jgi:hypothetical protein
MTEEWWRKYKDNKDKNENKIFTQVESELKRRFKNDRTPEELYSMCKTDNNYWKHYRHSENLDPDAISLVLCKDIGCDLMYCQTKTHKSKPEEEFFGCKEQYNTFRECYVTEKRKFNASHKEEEWLINRKLIPEYIEKQLIIQKEQKDRLKDYTDMKVVAKVDESKIVDVKNKVGYF